MEVIASTYMFHGSRLGREHLGAMKESSLEAAEVFCIREHFDWTDADHVRQVLEASRSLEVRIESFHAPWDEQNSYDISVPDRSRRERALGQIRSAIDVLSNMGGKVFVIHPGGGVAEDRERSLRLACSVASLREIGRYARGRGVTLVIENPAPPDLGSTAAELDGIIQGVKGDEGSFCLDVGHAHLSPGGIPAFVELGYAPLVVHLSDNRGSEDDHLPPPQGSIDWETTFSSLRTGFSGRAQRICYNLELETFPGSERLQALRTWVESRAR
jgi:sugar phosphate isomerase/epimerase